ncbi:MFS transporter [Mucilaginibacter sp. 22184]|uniref:MFS transporter n=1 Tax=Mucilaginibacter sp. 22184 TaxID=3453887 RepID=UPI003F863DF0
MNTISNKWFALTILLAAPLLSVLDVFIINVAVPSIKLGIMANDSEMQLVIAIYLLGYASFQITSGRAGDYLGRKKVFIAGMFLFTFFSCVCGFSESPFQLIICRFFQGVSAAIMTPQTIAMMQMIFPSSTERTKAVGLYGIVMGFATILGQFLGGYLSNTHWLIAGWRLIFFVNLPLGTLAIVLATVFLEETGRKNDGRPDYSGALILTASLFSLVIPLIIGREDGWPAWSFGLLIFAAILFIYFRKNQQTKLTNGLQPLVNLGLFRIRDFNRGITTVIFYFMMHTSYLLIISVYLQNGLGINSYQNGLFFVVFGLSATISSLLSIKAVQHFGKIVLQIGALLMLISFFLQDIYLNKNASYLSIYLQLGFYGFGGGIVLPSLLNMALRAVPLEFAGAASGVYTTIQQSSSALGISLIGGVFYHFLDHGQYHKANFLIAFHWGLGAEIICITVVSYLLYKLPKQTPKVDTGEILKEKYKLDNQF